MINTPKELLLFGHQIPVASLAFTRDGQTLISATAGGCAFWWSLETGEMQRHLRLNCGSHGVTLSPDDSILITDGGQVYDARTASLLRRSSRYMHPYAFSPYGQMFACAAYVPRSDDYQILITDIRSGQTQRKLPCAGSPASVAFSSDGELLAVYEHQYEADSGPINYTTVWNLHSGEARRTLEGEYVSLFGVQSSDARLLAVSRRGTRIWNAETVELRTVLPEPDRNHDNIGDECTDMSRDGRLLTVVSFQDAVGLWDLTSCDQRWLTEPYRFYERVWAIAISPGGDALAAGRCDGTIQIWSTGTGKLKHTLGGRCEVVRKVLFEADTIKSMHYGGTACFWQTSSQVPNTLDETFTGMISSTFNQIHDLGPNLWRVGTSNPVMQSEIPDGYYPVCISSDGSLLGLSCNDGIIVILNRSTGTLLTALAAASWRHGSAIFSPDNRYMAASADNWDATRVLDTTTGTIYMEIAAEFPVPNALDTVAFSARSRLFAIGRDDSKIMLWSLKSRKLIRTLDAGGEGLHAIAISPDEKLIAVAMQYSETVWIKNLDRTGKDVPLAGHSGDILSLDYSSDGSRIVTGSDDGTVKLWEAASGKLLTTYVVFRDSSWATYTPEGDYKCSPGAEKHLVWKVGNEVVPVSNE